MGSFTQAAVATVQQFAADIGVEAEVGPDGSYSFFFSHWGAFAIVPSDDGVNAILSLARTPTRSDAASRARLLAFAGRDETTQEFLHCAIGPDAFICAVAVDQREFDLVTLSRQLERLVAALDVAA